MENLGKITGPNSKLPPFLPPEAAKFAKQLGFSLDGLEPEAQHIWNHLEKLSTENPVEYERFVAEQMAAAKEDTNTDNGPKGRSFRPNAEFVIETKSFDGDGTKVREVNPTRVTSITSSSADGKPFYINICSSELIEPPKDKSGQKIESSRSIADGLEIPLLIGPIRPLQNDQSNAIDVIFHPVIPKICREERYFRGQILELAQDWILQDTNIKFKKNSYEDIAEVKYKGGLGDQNEIPVLFHIDDSLLQGNEESSAKANNTSSSTSTTQNKQKSNHPLKPTSNPTGKSKNEDLLSSTGSLLKEINRGKDGSAIEEIKTLNTKSTKIDTTKDKDKKNDKASASAKSGPIIQEIGKDFNSHPINDTESVNPSKKELTKKVSFKDEITTATTTVTAPTIVKDDLVAIKEKKYNEPNKIELQNYQELLDQFENPDGNSRFSNASSEDAESMLVRDLAKLLAPDHIPNALLTPPPAPKTTLTDLSTPSVSTPSISLVETNKAVHCAPAPPINTFSIKPTDSFNPILFSNSHPDIVPVKHTFQEEMKQYVIEITGIRSTASMESLDLVSSKHEIIVQADETIFEKQNHSNSTISSSVKVMIKLQFNSEKSIIREKVKASWKKKIQTLLITVPFH